MVEFSKALIQDYQNEMFNTYGVSVSDADAQLQLLSLTRSLFPTATAKQITESRESAQGKAVFPPTCADSLSVMLTGDGGDEVGSSITPTSRQENN